MGRPSLNGSGTRVFSGARAIFIFNGETVGFASGVNGSEEINYEPVDVLDHLDAQEHVPVGYRVSLSAQVFRTIDGVGNGNSNPARPGSLKQQNIFPKFSEILLTDGVDVIIQDKITGKTIFLMRNVKCASYNFQISARGLVGQNLTFVGTRVSDEAGE